MCIVAIRMGFKGYLLKPMQIPTHSYTSLLKPMLFASNNRPRDPQNRSKVLKTPTPVHNSCSKKAAEAGPNLQSQGPARGKSSPSRPRTASPRPHARHARHARHETKTKTNTKRSPGFGGVLTVLAPPNLRFYGADLQASRLQKILPLVQRYTDRRQNNQT